MKLQMNPLTELVLLIAVFLLYLGGKIVSFVSKRQTKTNESVYQYFSANVIGTFPGLSTVISFREIESISDNIRYNSTSDIWEVFRVSHDEFNQNTDIHQGRRGYWTIVDNESMIRDFERMFIQKTKSISTPTIQM